MKSLEPKALIAQTLKTFQYGGRLNPSRDWLILLCVFIILFVGSIAWNITSLLRTLSQDPASYADAVEATVEEDAVETAKRLLEERSQRRGSVGSENSVVDPSLD